MSNEKERHDESKDKSEVKVRVEQEVREIKFVRYNDRLEKSKQRREAEAKERAHVHADKREQKLAPNAEKVNRHSH